MSLRFPVELSLETPESGRLRGDLGHGELVSGRVTRISSDGQALIQFPDFQARAPAEAFLRAGSRVYASVQRTRDETLLSLLPAEEGDILSGRLMDSKGADALAKFGTMEVRVRVPPGRTTPPPGSPLQAQLQLTGGSPTLKILPSLHGPITGTVLTVREDGTALLDVDGTTLLAKTGADIQPGESVHAALRNFGDRMPLLIVQNPSAEDAHGPTQGGADTVVARILANTQYNRLLGALLSGTLSIDEPGKALLLMIQEFLARPDTGNAAWARNLASALQTLFLNPDRNDFAAQVASAIKESGVFFEASLLEAAMSREAELPVPNDLKMALLAANREISKLLGNKPEALPTANIPQMSARIAQLLELVTAEQLLNSRFHASGQLYIQLPFTESSNMGRVEIRISRQGGGSRKIDPRNVALTLIVTASKLGRIRASLSIVNGQVSCQFKASRDSVTQLFNRYTGMLKEGLERLDYRVTYIGCVTSKDDREYSFEDALTAVLAEGFDVSA
ncbi:MAG: hypothetical protein Kow0099_28730 [Candidatus Abyssubacteria bacterium]